MPTLLRCRLNTKYRSLEFSFLSSTLLRPGSLGLSRFLVLCLQLRKFTGNCLSFPSLPQGLGALLTQLRKSLAHLVCLLSSLHCLTPVVLKSIVSSLLTSDFGSFWQWEWISSCYSILAGSESPPTQSCKARKKLRSFRTILFMDACTEAKQIPVV